MNCHDRERNVSQAAQAAGVDWKTARRYIEGAPGPEEPRPERSWRTHPDDFASVWPEGEKILAGPEPIQAKALFEELMRRYPGQFARGQLRSFQRRVAKWRREHGAEPERVFMQEHRPGERLELDWCDGKWLGVSIAGQVLDHKLCQCVLPYSNYQWATVCSSESFSSLRRGLQEALWSLGKAPLIVQTDQSSTATHPRGKGQRGRDWNERYLGLLGHYGLRAEKIQVRTPQQNGDVESAHRHLGSAVANALVLRGGRNFDSLGEYESFVQGLCRERNDGRKARVNEELAVMRELPSVRLPEWDEVQCWVSREGLVRVNKGGYSVPSRWIGRQLRVRVYEEQVEFYHGIELVGQAPRMKSQGVVVDWRHVLPELRRKPGAMARWRHRESLFPSVMWRQVYEGFCGRYSAGRAEREYLGCLALALEHGLEKLTGLIQAAGPAVSLDMLRQQLSPKSQMEEPTFQADLKAYDQLLEVDHG